MASTSTSTWHCAPHIPGDAHTGVGAGPVGSVCYSALPAVLLSGTRQHSRFDCTTLNPTHHEPLVLPPGDCALRRNGRVLSLRPLPLLVHRRHALQELVPLQQLLLGGQQGGSLSAFSSENGVLRAGHPDSILSLARHVMPLLGTCNAAAAQLGSAGHAAVMGAQRHRHKMDCKHCVQQQDKSHGRQRLPCPAAAAPAAAASLLTSRPPLAAAPALTSAKTSLAGIDCENGKLLLAAQCMSPHDCACSGSCSCSHGHAQVHPELLRGFYKLLLYNATSPVLLCSFEPGLLVETHTVADLLG